MEEYSNLNGDDFNGAPEHNFTATLRINIKEEKLLKQWLQEMFEYSKCTYRTTRTYNVRQKRLLYRVDMHCQHKQKILTTRQKGLKAVIKNKPSPLMGELRNKKTNCPSTLTLKLEEPTRKELYSDKKDILTSHKAKLQLKFNHNHPINSAHVLSFRPVNEKTKEKYYKLFQSGHSAASARHYYENTLMDTCDEEELQGTMCDCSINPILQDVSRLYSQWRLSEYGSDRNGKVVAESLIEEISLYNITNAASGRKACVQVYDTGNTDETDSDTDNQPPKPKRKKISSSIPLIITACTPLMSRVHKNVKQAREMIFCDSTSCLEKYNCSLFIFSTSSPCGGLPLGVAITSDEKESTIKKALQLLLKVLPGGSFYGSKNGPKVVMTDDSNTEREAISQTWPNAHLLLCVFHFLQSHWTWLYEGKNKIKNEHRAILIGKVKELVYSKTEKDLMDAYSKLLKNDIVAMNPNFQSHIKVHWLRDNNGRYATV